MICTLPDVLAKEIYETQGGTLAIYFFGVLESKLVSVLCLISESQTCMKHRVVPWSFFVFEFWSQNESVLCQNVDQHLVDLW